MKYLQTNTLFYSKMGPSFGKLANINTEFLALGFDNSNSDNKSNIR